MKNKTFTTSNPSFLMQQIKKKKNGIKWKKMESVKALQKKHHYTSSYHKRINDETSSSASSSIFSSFSFFFLWARVQLNGAHAS